VLSFTLLMFTCCLADDQSLPPANRVSLKETHNGYEVTIDNKQFAEYRKEFQVADRLNAPIIWPVIGPNDKPMTRAFPMTEGVPGETTDHPNHKSIWFSQDEINGNKHRGARSTIEHKEFVKTECDGKTATLVTKNNWLDNRTNETLCSDVRTVTFGVIDKHRYIDYDVILTAEQDDIHIGDTKEGTFAIRVPSSLDVDANMPDDRYPDRNANPGQRGGTIVNAQGDKNDAAWGKRSEWVDYSGLVDGEIAGIAILNHPASFRHPTWWHVRTYGLFSANPFGIKEFEPELRVDGSVVLKKGESLRFYHRVILHRGDAVSLDLEKLFKDYSVIEKIK
jgi:hypothetical protein